MQDGNKKGLSTGAIVGFVLAGFLVLVVAVGISLFMGYVSASNGGVQAESRIEQLNKDSENVLSTSTIKIKNMAQIPGMYVKDLKEIIRDTFEGRYGKDGSKAVVQFIQEQNHQVDSKLYLNIQNEMAAGQDEFRIAQSNKLTACRNYENSLGYFWQGMFLKWAGYPKKDLAKLCQVVSDDQTQEAFKTGKQKTIELGN